MNCIAHVTSERHRKESGEAALLVRCLRDRVLACQQLLGLQGLDRQPKKGTALSRNQNASKGVKGWDKVAGLYAGDSAVALSSVKCGD